MDDVQRLGPRIHEILTSPNTDLDSISAKRIRKQLQDEDPLVTPDFIRNNKAEIDNLITTIFEAVRANTPWTPAATSTSTSPKIRSIAPPLPKPVSTPTHAGVKRKLEETTRTESSPAFPLAKRVTSSKLSDAEIARQLDAQINGHTTRSGSVSSKRSGKGKKQKKSKEEVDDSDAEEDGNGSGEVPVKKKRGGGFQKPYALSPALAVLTGESQMSRPAVVKALWDHIKGLNLQNPENRKEILCDDQMRAVFGVAKIDMFRMNKELGRHLGDL